MWSTGSWALQVGGPACSCVSVSSFVKWDSNSMYFTVDVFNWGDFALKESFGNVWKHNGGGGGIGRHMVRRRGEARDAAKPPAVRGWP